MQIFSLAAGGGLGATTRVAAPMPAPRPAEDVPTSPRRLLTAPCGGSACISSLPAQCRREFSCPMSSTLPRSCGAMRRRPGSPGCRSVLSTAAPLVWTWWWLRGAYPLPLSVVGMAGGQTTLSWSSRCRVERGSCGGSGARMTRWACGMMRGGGLPGGRTVRELLARPLRLSGCAVSCDASCVCMPTAALRRGVGVSVFRYMSASAIAGRPPLLGQSRGRGGAGRRGLVSSTMQRRSSAGLCDGMRRRGGTLRRLAPCTRCKALPRRVVS